MSACRGVILAALAGIVCGCAGFSGKNFETRVSHPAVSGPQGLRGWIAAFGSEERLPHAVKGIGQLTLRTPDRRQTARVAWAAARNGRLRLEILSPAGQPVMSLATDGQTVYGRTSAKDYFKYPARDPDLNRFFSIRLKASRMIRLLMGSVVVEPHSGALLAPAADGQGYRLSLKHWHRTRENIGLSLDLSDIRHVEVFDFDGALAYRAAFEKTETIDGYTLPRELVLSNDNGASMRLRVSRQWVDAAVAPSAFVLAPP